MRRIWFGQRAVLLFLAIHMLTGGPLLAGEVKPPLCQGPVLGRKTALISEFFHGSASTILANLQDLGTQEEGLKQQLEMPKGPRATQPIDVVLLRQIEGFEKQWPFFYRKISKDLQGRKDLRELLLLSIIIKELGHREFFVSHFGLSAADSNFLDFRGKSGILGSYILRGFQLRIMQIEFEKVAQHTHVSLLDVLYVFELLNVAKESVHDQRNSLFNIAPTGEAHFKKSGFENLEDFLRKNDSIEKIEDDNLIHHSFESPEKKQQFMEAYHLIAQAQQHVGGFQVLQVSESSEKSVNVARIDGVPFSTFFGDKTISQEKKRNALHRVLRYSYKLYAYLSQQGFVLKHAHPLVLALGIRIPSQEFFFKLSNGQWTAAYFRMSDILINPQTMDLFIMHVHTYQTAHPDKLSIQSQLILSTPVEGHPGLRITSKAQERDLAQAVQYADRFHRNEGGTLVFIPLYNGLGFPFGDGILYNKKGIAIALYSSTTASSVEHQTKTFLENAERKYSLLSQYQKDPESFLDSPLGIESLSILSTIHNLFEVMKLNLPVRFNKKKSPPPIDKGLLRKHLRGENSKLKSAKNEKPLKVQITTSQYDSVRLEHMPEISGELDQTRLANVVAEMDASIPTPSQLRTQVDVLFEEFKTTFANDSDLPRLKALRSRWDQLANKNLQAAAMLPKYFRWYIHQSRNLALPLLESFLSSLEKTADPIALTEANLFASRDSLRLTNTNEFKNKSLESLTLESLDSHFDLLARQTVNEKKGVVGEVEMAFIPTMMGFPDRRIRIVSGRLDFHFDLVGEKVFAIGPQGALNFKKWKQKQYSTQADIAEVFKYYGVLLPKGFAAFHGLDSALHQSNSTLTLEQALKKVPSGPEKIFTINHEVSTRERGQVHLPFTRRIQLPTGEVISLLEYMRRNTIGVVEFDMTGKILRILWK